MLTILLTAIILSTAVIGAPSAEIGHYVKVYENANCVGGSSQTTLYPGNCIGAPTGKSVLVYHQGAPHIVGWSEPGCRGKEAFVVGIGMACYNFNGADIRSWSIHV